MKSFIFKSLFAWSVVLVLFLIVYNGIFQLRLGSFFALIMIVVLGSAMFRAVSHVRRVHLITDRIDSSTLASRHRRQIEIPFPPGEVFAFVDAAIRELPNVENVESAADSLQVHARVKRVDPYLADRSLRVGASELRRYRNQVRAIITPGEGTSSLTLICEPERGAWIDWFAADYGTNLENMEAISRSISRRVSERRKIEEEQARETATEKELTVAKLSLLHAQVEPHFLYNTLASAQVLTRSDPARADQLLGHLIAYLRNSVPRAEDSMSTIGEELERARAYLEIMHIRMGERLSLKIEVPEQLKGVPMPAMMLQTLVENAIKHGLEPLPSGGTVWIIGRALGGKASITVADDGRGFSEDGGGTGIGLKNIRERLRLAYGDTASFAIVANFPKGVAATITVPNA